MKKLTFLVILAILAIVTACNKNNSSNPAVNPVFAVKLTDAPNWRYIHSSMLDE